MANKFNKDQIAPDAINDTHIDFGTGANQVSLDDIPDGSTSKLGQDCSTAGSPSFTGLTLSGLTAGSVLFAGTGGVISQDNTNLKWDNTAKCLGIGQTAPTRGLHILGSTADKTEIRQETNQNVNILINMRRNQSGGAYNTVWYNYIPASSTQMRWYNGSDLMYLTTTGRLGVGVSPEAGRFHAYLNGAGPTGYGISTVETDSSWNECFYNTYSSGNAIHCNQFRMFRSRGTKASKSAVTDGDLIGGFTWNGWDGSSSLYRAGFYAKVNGTVSSGNIPLDIVFETNSSATATGSERMRIASDGKVSVEEMLHAKSGVRTKVSTADVSSPPTDSELDSAFGAPADVGAGFVGIVNDNDAGTAEYICWSDGTNWFYATGTKAT